MHIFPRWSLDVQEDDRSPKDVVTQWSMTGPEITHGHCWILAQIPIGFHTAVAGNSPRICTDMPHCFAGTAAMFMHHVLRFSLTFILKTKDKPYTNTTLSPILSEMLMPDLDIVQIVATSSDQSGHMLMINCPRDVPDRTITLLAPMPG
jgi:hypothetical protein